MMRVVTGSAKGKKLATPEGDATRPTSERVKQAMFSSIQFDIEGRRVLDLFAGSGQLGIEAMSRGAESAMFIDASPDAMKIIKENTTRCGFFSSCRYLISDYRSYLRKAGGRDRYSLIFLDPPYAMACVGDALERILAEDLAVPGCLIVTESGDPDIFRDHEGIRDRFEVVKAAKYSISYVTILSLKEEDPCEKH